MNLGIVLGMVVLSSGNSVFMASSQTGEGGLGESDGPLRYKILSQKSEAIAQGARESDGNFWGHTRPAGTRIATGEPAAK